LNPPNPDFLVHNRDLRSGSDLRVVRLLAVDPVLRKLNEHAAGPDTVLGEIGSHWRATVDCECRTLRRGHDDALFLPLLFDFTHSAFLCLAQVIARFRHARRWRGYLE